jgi:hypothetical protein
LTVSPSAPPSIEEMITQLVRDAPAIDARVADDLVLALRSIRLPLAHAIARVLELVIEQLVDPGIALPALAMACATLVDERSDERSLAAAQYEIETLLPMPDPVIPASSLRRR